MEEDFMVEVFDTPEGRAFYGLCLRLDMGPFRNQALTSGAITFRQSITLRDLAGRGTEVHNAKLLDMLAERGTVEKYRALAATVKALGHHGPYTQFMTLLEGVTGEVVDYELVKRPPTLFGSNMAPPGATAQARQPSQERHINPWLSTEYKSNCDRLIKSMNPRQVLAHMEVLHLIGYYDREEIEGKVRRTAQNNAILQKLSLGRKHFGKFREMLRHYPRCKEVAEELDLVGPDPKTDSDCIVARELLMRTKDRDYAPTVSVGSPPTTQDASVKTASHDDTDKVFDTPQGRAFYGLCLRLGMGSFRTQALTSGAITFRQHTTLAALAGSGPDDHNDRLLQMVAEGRTLEKYRALAATVKALGHHEPYTQFMTFLEDYEMVEQPPKFLGSNKAPPGAAAQARQHGASAVEESSPASTENAGFETASQQDTGEEVTIPAQGGEFDLYNGTVRLSVPSGAVGVDGVKCTVYMSGSKGEERPFKQSSVYLSQAFMFASDTSLSFHQPVTVTIPTDISFSSGGKVLVFSSSSEEEELPDFQDVTEECRPVFADGAVQFTVTHFSEWTYLITSPAIRIGTCMSELRELFTTKTVRLDASAAKDLTSSTNCIPLSLYIATADSQSPLMLEAGCQLVTSSATSPRMYLNHYDAIDIDLDCYRDSEDPKSSSSGRGGYWTVPSFPVCLKKDTVMEVQLKQLPVHPLVETPHSRSRQVIAAEGRFKCTIRKYFGGCREAYVHFQVKATATELPSSSSADRQDQTRQSYRLSTQLADAGVHGGSREGVLHQVHASQSLPEERKGNPWRHPRFIETTYSLKVKLTQFCEARALCYSLRLIGNHSDEQLQLLKSKFEHNDQLLSYLKTGDADSFAKFREVMRYLNQEVDVFAKILEKWDTIGPFKEDYQHIVKQLIDG